MYKLKDFLDFNKESVSYNKVFRVDEEYFEKVDKISRDSLMASSSIIDYIEKFSDEIDKNIEIKNLSEITVLFYMMGYAIKLIESSFKDSDEIEKEIQNKLNFFIHLLKGIEKTL